MHFHHAGAEVAAAAAEEEAEAVWLPQAHGDQAHRPALDSEDLPHVPDVP